MAQSQTGSWAPGPRCPGPWALGPRVPGPDAVSSGKQAPGRFADPVARPALLLPFDSRAPNGSSRNKHHQDCYDWYQVGPKELRQITQNGFKIIKTAMNNERTQEHSDSEHTPQGTQ